MNEKITTLTYELHYRNLACKNHSIGLTKSDKKIRLLVFLGTRLQPKPSESLRLRLRNPDSDA